MNRVAKRAKTKVPKTEIGHNKVNRQTKTIEEKVLRISQ